MNTTPSGTTATVLIRQRYSWRRSYWDGWSPVCDTGMISSQGIIGTTFDTLDCYSGPCVTGSWVSTDVPCTDFSNDTDFSSGERYDQRILTLNQSYVVGYRQSAWFSLVINGGGYWQMTGKIELTVRADGVINTSPVTSTLPIIYKQINVQHVHVVQMADADPTDTLKCRWSSISGNSNGRDECATACAPTLPSGYTLISNNCTLVFNLNLQGYYGIALQIEDFYTSSSLTPMSSVPIQFLFYGRPNPGGNCSTPPSIIGVRPNLACIGTPIGQYYLEKITV